MRDSRLGTYGAHDPAGELCREAFGARGDPGRLCRAGPDRRARAGARHVACDVDEPGLCAQGRIGRAMPASPIAATAAIAGGARAASSRWLSLSWRNALYAALAARRERARHGVAGACGKSAARPATCSAAPSRSAKPRSCVLLAARLALGVMSARDKSLADPPRAGRRTARRDSWPGRAGRSRRCRSLRRAQGKIAGERVGGVQPGAPHVGNRAERWGSIRLEQAAFREQDFGAWTGRRHDDLDRRARRRLPRFLEIAGEQRAARRRKFCRSDRAHERGPRAAARGRRVLVVHSGTIRAVLAHRARPRRPTPRCAS